MPLDRGYLDFCRLTVRSGILNKDQLRQCVRENRKAEKEGTPQGLCAIMVSKGLLTNDQIQDMLALWRKTAEETVSVACVSCGALYSVKKNRSGKRLSCTKCGGILQIKESIT